MKVVTLQGINIVEVREVKNLYIKKSDDIIVKITTAAIYGSYLLLIHGMIPNLPTDFIIGHEPMGVLEEVVPARQHRSIPKGNHKRWC